jgi:hypothetical protein
MPVFDAQTQNGDHAFIYMVIEIVLISRFRKFGPYYKNIGYYRVTKFRLKFRVSAALAAPLGVKFFVDCGHFRLTARLAGKARN